MVQHLFTNMVKPARSKRDSQQAKTHGDHLLFKLAENIHSIWDANSFQEMVKKAIDEHAESKTHCWYGPGKSEWTKRELS